MASLGDTLRSRRIELGKTLADAETATRIRARLLSALEDGAYDQLPNPAYVRGYITSYARWLELDVAPLLTMYRAESGAVGPTAAMPRRETVVPSREKAHAVPWKPAVLIAGLIVTVLLVFWGVRSLGSNEKTTPLPTEPETTETATSPGVVASSTSSSATTPSIIATPEAGAPLTTVPFTLKIVVGNGTSWARVTVDGQKAYEGTLVSGQEKEFLVAEEAAVRIGRPSVVKVYRDGTEVALPESASTPTLTLKAEPKQ